jgi:hypothetical protein
MNTIQLKKIILSKIDLIKDKNNCLLIFRFLKENKINYTQKSNGIYFNLNEINLETLNKLNIFLDTII